MTDRTDYKIYSAIVVFCAVVEIIWICGAAALAIASHYNTEPIMSAIYGFMGLAAVVLTSATLVYGIAMLRAGVPSPLTTSISISLILTFILTLIVAFRLASNESHFIGDTITGSGLPVFGWSTEVGDLRVSHFLATHAMHFIPAIAFAAYIMIPALVTYTTVIALSLGYTALTFATFVQALAGRPFIS